MTRATLNGDWQWVADAELGADRQGWLDRPPRRGLKTVSVPGVWQTQFPDYHGPAVYYRRITVPAAWRGQRIFLCSEGANYLARVYVDGREVGAHEGGYTGFELELTRVVQPGGDHLLAIWIIHAAPGQNIGGLDLRDVASSKETWYYPYAGLWGGVFLESRPAVFIADLHVRPHLARARATFHLTLDGPGPVSGVWTVRDARGRRCAQGAFVRPAGRGARRVSVVVPLTSPRAWSPEDPHLYTVEGALSNGAIRRVRFGLRDVQIRRHGLVLNGRPFYVKGILLQPNYPESLINPADATFARREVALIKAGGFNLVRAHLKPMLPCALDAADELGLLVYEESALAWIRRGPELRRRARQEMAAMIRRDRNHPSIVLWGIVNESGRADRQIRRQIFHLARGLDPTRPVIGNSGPVAIAPHAGWSGRTEAQPARRPRPAHFEDVHIYVRAPVPGAIFDFLRQLGDPARMVPPHTLGLTPEASIAPWMRRLRRLHPSYFLSEFGYGGVMDYARALRQYRVRDGQDARQYAEFARALADGFRARGLAREFGSLARLTAQANTVQAEGNKRQTEAIRLNRLVTGYVLTQLNDVGWESSAGITDVWREPKPAYAAMQQANRAIIGVVRPDARHLHPGQSVRARAWVVTDWPLGACQVRLAWRAPDGRLLGRAELPALGGGRVRATRSAVLGQAGAPGRYHLCLQVVAGGRVRYESREAMYVLPTAMAFEVPRAGVTTLGRWRVVRDPATLEVTDWRRLIRATRAGASVLITGLTPDVLEPLVAARVLPWPLKAVQGMGAFVGQFHYLRKVPEFRGLPVGDVATQALVETLPHWSLHEVAGARVLAGAVTVSTFTVPGDKIRHRGRVDWLVGIMDLPLGRGRVRLCQYDLWQDDPMSRLLQARLLA
ncbi:MAG: hypothetical protein K8T26_11610 [Lentisphaerae bacterium]|nr:hypothetical protein [Lentisphaerota bacterium]